MSMVAFCCIFATPPPRPDYSGWWQEVKAAGYPPEEIESQFAYFTCQSEISEWALFKAVQVATRTLHDENIKRLEQRMEIDWERANFKG